MSRPVDKAAAFGLEVIEGGKTVQKNFICPWCGGSFVHRFINSDGVLSLQDHWLTDPRCKANARSNNPTTSKYGMAAGIENIPGEATLNRIRKENCEHPENLRENLYRDMTGEGPAIGYRCGYCYTEVPSGD